jgi:hypothetical protein
MKDTQKRVNSKVDARKEADKAISEEQSSPKTEVQEPSRSSVKSSFSVFMADFKAANSK